jgi:hypothetical protein
MRQAGRVLGCWQLKRSKGTSRHSVSVVARYYGVLHEYVLLWK